jgi:radical SAM family uncharacterized protein/radical SAM-linked protein
MQSKTRKIIAQVSKPFRYVGGEVGSVSKEWNDATLRICLAFPDVYEIGTSHIGLSILYKAINDTDYALADRCYTPWEDMEKILREEGVPLFGLESQKPLSDFDILGFSLAYELTYTNVLAMLDLSGVPLRASDRGDTDPLVIAGGPCAFNPEPVAPFFDLIVIGDGEGVILEITRIVAEGKNDGLSREDLLRKLSSLSGVYVPNIPSIQEQKPGRAFIADLDKTPFPKSPLVAHSSIQDRLAVEVARGCTRGCRFCQAGYIYRPLRQRSEETASALAVDGLSARGDEQFSFLSLSIGDWAPLGSALSRVHEGCGEMRVDAGLPSLRTESLTDEVIEALGRARSGSFTLAPEAGSERMRRLINKGNTDEDLYASVEKVFASGWHAVKLYFMIGLPGEEMEDIDGIVKIAMKCRDIGRRHHKRPDITVSTSTMVPKAHTPFQWERQISIEETLEKQRYLKRLLRGPGIAYRWHNAELSFIEGVFARGGRELADVIERAYEMGARFDAWDECFDFERWQNALGEFGLKGETYLEERDASAELPWEHIGAGPDRAFLLKERGLASELASTPDCAHDICSKCGVCDFKSIKNRLAPDSVVNRASIIANIESEETAHKPQNVIYRYRIRYTKTGRAAFLGSVETLDAIRRAVRGGGLPLAYSEGFHPRARVSAGPALPVGMESDYEFIDVHLGKDIDPAHIISSMGDRLPDGIDVLEARKLDSKDACIEDSMSAQEYEVSFEGVDLDLAAAIKSFEDASEMIVVRERGKRKRRTEVDIKGLIDELAVVRGGVLGVRVLNIRPTVKVFEMVAKIFDLPEDFARTLPIKKTAIEWK